MEENKKDFTDIIRRILRQEERLSFSALRAFIHSPREFVKYKTTKYEPSELMLIGQAAHCIALEGEDAFKAQYFNGRSAEGETRTRLTPARERRARVIAAEILRHGVIKQLLNDNETKTEHDETFLFEGLKFKRILDIKHTSGIIDVKTGGKSTKKPSAYNFKYKVLDLDYHVQAALYCAKYETIEENVAKVAELPRFAWLMANERESVIFPADVSVLVAGFDKLEQILKHWRRCASLGLWEQGVEFYQNAEQRTIYMY